MKTLSVQLLYAMAWFSWGLIAGGYNLSWQRVAVGSFLVTVLIDLVIVAFRKKETNAIQEQK